MTTVLGISPLSNSILALAKLRSTPAAAAPASRPAAPSTAPGRTMVDQVKALRGPRA